MDVESAELVKHGLNAFLAVSVAFANELATIAERVGADAAEVERGLKTERRIGPRAYLRPGAAFAGGTLARDVDYLTQIGEREHVPTHLLRAVRASNDEHRRWARRTLESLVGADGGLSGHVIGVWGLVYKHGNGHPATVELGRALPRARRCGSRRSSPRLGRASPARRPLRQSSRFARRRWPRRRVHRPSSSRPIGPPTARSTREGSWRRCEHRSSSTRTAFSRPRSATSPVCATSGSGAGRGD